jgi:hypothetical protein
MIHGTEMLNHLTETVVPVIALDVGVTDAYVCPGIWFAENSGADGACWSILLHLA